MTTASMYEGRALQTAERRRIRRNIIIYTLGVMAYSVAGGVIAAGGAQIGQGLFIISPFLMAVLLRTLGKDGWADAGLRLGSLRWYPFAILVFPAVFGIILVAEVLAGSINFTGPLGALFRSVMAGLPLWLMFAMFEEWGWRGYLEPRLARLGVPDLRRHLLVGVIWGVWHIPYILVTPGYTDLPALTFAVLLAASMLSMAVVYGQMRKASGTVWTAVLAHGIGNAIAQPLIFEGMAEFNNPIVLAIRPETLLFIIIWAALGWAMLRRGAAQPMPGVDEPAMGVSSTPHP
jgi:membrane protease YdiL (CAAX protease family)